MNVEALEKLKEIMEKHIDVLTNDEKAFLKARRGYLNEEQLERYSGILETKKEEKEDKKPVKGKK